MLFKHYYSATTEGYLLKILKLGIRRKDIKLSVMKILIVSQY